VVNDKLLFEQPDTFKKAIPIPSMVSGHYQALARCSDPLYAEGVWGPGAGVITNDSKIRAPFDGVVIAIDALNYSITVKSRFGLKCTIKYGESTHHLYGEKFTCALKPGNTFKKNDMLFSVNSVWLKRQGIANVCIITVLNAHALIGVLPTNQRFVSGGHEALLTLYI
jgi:PTS system glucose-specific IIA component